MPFDFLKKWQIFALELVLCLQTQNAIQSQLWQKWMLKLGNTELGQRQGVYQKEQK